MVQIDHAPPLSPASLAGIATEAGLLDALARFWDAEDRDTDSATLAAPFAQWHGTAAPDRAQARQVADRLITDLAAPTASLPAAIAATGLAMRLAEGDWSLPLSQLADAARDTILPARLRLELAWQFRAFRLWRPLEHQACALLADLPPHTAPSHVSAIADMAMLARYRRVVPYLQGGKRRIGPASRARATGSLGRLQAWIGRRIDGRAYPMTPSLHAAIIAQVNGHLADAERLFLEAASLEGACLGIFNPHRLLAAPDRMQQAPLPDDLWAACRTDRPHTNAAPPGDTLLVSCDRAYFERYAPPFMASVRAQGGGAGLVLHCVGFEPDQAMLAAFSDIDIRVTVDPVDMDGWSPDQKKGYFAGARYLYLPYYLERYEWIAVVDLDGGLFQPPDFPDGKRSDIKLVASALVKAGQPHRLPWEAVSAGNFSIAATAAGRAFAAGVSRSLHHHLRQSLADPRRHDFFFSDQIGLYQAWLRKDRIAPSARFRAIRPCFTQDKDWAFGKNAC